MRPVGTRITSNALTALAQAAQGRPDALLALARTQLCAGNPLEAQRLATDARRLLPVPEHRRALRILAAATPSWHFEILRDRARHAMFDSAIRRLCAGRRVLDMGTGTGLLAMMAARAGAAAVFACEASPALSDVARRVIQSNGFADRITLFDKPSFDITVDDLGGPVDVVVSEILSNDLVGQQVVQAVVDARSRLLAPEGRCVPSAARAVAAPACWEAAGRGWLQDVAGFDLRPLEALDADRFLVRVNRPDLRLCGSGVPVLSLDFSSTEATAARPNQVALNVEEGPANGVLQWLEFDLAPGTTYSNRPGTGVGSCWDAWFYPFDGGLTAATGTRVRASFFLEAGGNRLTCQAEVPV